MSLLKESEGLKVGEGAGERLGRGSAFLAGSKAVVLSEMASPQFFTTAAKPLTVDPTGKMPAVVPWGDDNAFPSTIISQVEKSPFVSQNMLFNISTGYGDGILPVKRLVENNNVKFVPYEGNREVKAFFEENRMDLYLLEQLTDLNFFYNVFPEVIFNAESGKNRKIVQLTSKEAAFSRWSQMAEKGKDKGRIQYHYYSAEWDKNPSIDNIVVTPVLDRVRPVFHLREIMQQDLDKPAASRRNRFIIPVCLPTPGKPYYARPYWLALIESGVFAFSQKIMPFKNAMMDNMANIKYIVELGPGYFEEIFRRERITDDKAKTKRIKQEYADIDRFLRSVKNTHKSIITHQKLDPRGQPYPMIVIQSIKNEIGGELIADHEEVASIMSYGMGVHPSLVGNSPGKSKTINGTEARELFILKQAGMKPIRDLLLFPLYLIKAINNWPEDLFFAIPNIQLTTLDKDKSGSNTVIPSTQ